MQMRSYLKREGNVTATGFQRGNSRRAELNAFRPRVPGPDANPSRLGIGNQAMQRPLRFGPAPQVQRQPASPDAPAAAPTYPGCTEAITGIADANERLERARLRARDFVQVAIAAIGRMPAAGSAAAIARARHFINPNATQRATIRDNYQGILAALNVENFVCSTQNICGDLLAGWLPADGLIHVCPTFWPLKYPCPPIVLIHEAAHDAGVDATIAPGHTMNRGTATYPKGNHPPPDGETSAQRIINPDAYGFYAAHIWRETDTGFRCGETT
jgi:hypothetical protein